MRRSTALLVSECFSPSKTHTSGTPIRNARALLNTVVTVVMPRKKRMLQRSAADAAAGPSALERPDSLQPFGDAILPDGIIRNTFAIGEDIHPAECLRNIQEMFQGKLDADVIHMVLVECEFNVNNALEALFTLLPPDTGVDHPSQPSNMSTSSESLAAGENIVTSEAEVHKSSEDSERESLQGVDACAAVSASNSDLALFVNAPPFVPSQPADNKQCFLEGSQIPRADPPLAWSKLVASNSELGFNITAPPGRSRSFALSASAKEQQKICDLVTQGRRVLVLMRGLPGSGKTTLALKICGGTGVVLSADHFFFQDGKYSFDKARLSEAHEWNKRRAKQAMQEGHSPVIIDNTNVEVWEMMPYVALALRSKYHVCVLEPDTPWKFDARQLAQKNMHGVPRRTIDSMLERYDRNVTSESLCQSFGISLNLSSSFADSGLDVKEGWANNNSCKAVEKTVSEPSSEVSQNPSTSSSSDKASITAPKETISLGDLMALVQNDSEESGSRSRQNSDSWSSGHDANDWEDVTERDDDFLWSARKCFSPCAQADCPLSGTIQEECDAPEHESSTSPVPDTTTAENDLESIVPAFTATAALQPCTEEATELPEPEVGISEAEAELYSTEEGVLEVPKPPRGSPRHLGAPARDDNTPVIVTPADFTAPWEPTEEEHSGGTTGPKEQRSPQRCKKSSKGLCEDSTVPSMPREVPHTVPRVAESSRHNHSSTRGPIFGLEKVVRSSTWTLPEFNIYEPIEPEQPADSGPQRAFINASSFTDPADVAVVRKVLLGESDELAVVVASDSAAAEAPDESSALLPAASKPNTLTRSTDTDDLPADDLDYAGRLSLLQQCMPTVKPPDLEDIFQHCHGDHAWAADLLLDTDVSCDLQPLVIKEECEGTGSSSSNETSQQHEPAVSLPLVTASKEKLNKQVPQMEQESQCSVKGPADATAGTRSTNPLQLNPANADREFTLQLDHSFACQLVEAFGSEGLHVSIDAFRSADLSVTVTSELAKQLHQLWMDTLRQAMSKEEEEMLKIAADSREDDPQGLQSGGEGSSRENMPENGPVVPLPPPALNDDPRWNKAPSEMSFREIMEMEAALEEKRKDWTKGNTYMDMATKLKHKQLYERFPGVDRQALDDIFVASNYSLIQSVSTINETLGMASDESSDENYEKQIVELVQMESMQPDEPEDMTWQPVVEGHEDMYDRLRLVGDYDVIRREATVHYHMRQESFRKAKEAYHRGMKTVAAFYSQQGRAYAEKMREANERASWKLLQLRNAQCDDNSLDLHGLHVQEAIQVLKNFVKLKKRESWCLQKKQTLRIITGRGAHSALNIPKVKFAVEGYLLSSQLNYREVQAGMFHVML